MNRTRSVANFSPAEDRAGTAQAPSCLCGMVDPLVYRGTLMKLAWLSCPRRRTHRHPRLESLEARDLPALFTVTSALDGGDGSLRQAILDANNNGNPAEVDVIRFDL